MGKQEPMLYLCQAACGPGSLQFSIDLGISLRVSGDGFPSSQETRLIGALVDARIKNNSKSNTIGNAISIPSGQFAFRPARECLGTFYLLAVLSFY